MLVSSPPDSPFLSDLHISTCCNRDASAAAADSVCGASLPVQSAVHEASLSPSPTASSAAAAGASSPPSPHDPAGVWSGFAQH